jgi:hypothetical protein
MAIPKMLSWLFLITKKKVEKTDSRDAIKEQRRIQASQVGAWNDYYEG